MCVSSNRRDFIYDVYIPVYHTDKFNAFISLTMRMSDFAPPNNYANIFFTFRSQ